MGYYDDYLEHHGILGQKWGVRRFENKNGHLTAAGLKRYEDGRKVTKAEQKAAGGARAKELEKAKAKTAEAKKAFKEANDKANSTFDQNDLVKARKAQGMMELRKKQESDTKARMKMDERAEKGKSAGKHEQKLIEKFKEKGMSQEEAEVAAYKRVKMEKAIAIAAGVTVAAAAAYGAKKYHDYVTDEVLEAGKTSMKRVTQDSSDGLYDTFYAAMSKGDQSKYVGMYGTQMKTQGAKDIYQKTIDLKENIKIASDKNAKSTMGEVLKNTSPENRREILNDLKAKNDIYQQVPMLKYSKQGKMLNKGLQDIAAGKYDTKAAYDAFNFNMTGGNQSKVYGEFKQALKDKGYSGIKDRNDASYSGYNAKTARIIFDNSKVKVSDVRKLSDNEIRNKNEAETFKMTMKAYAKMGVGVAGIAAASSAAGKASIKKENTKAIAEYKKEHPNSKLSNDEILENYYGGKK